MKNNVSIFMVFFMVLMFNNAFAFEGTCQKIGGMMICEYGLRDMSSDFGLKGPSFIVTDCRNRSKFYIQVPNQLTGENMTYNLNWDIAEVFYTEDNEAWCKMLWVPSEGNILKVSVFIPKKYKKNFNCKECVSVQ